MKLNRPARVLRAACMAVFAIGLLQLGAADARALTMEDLVQWKVADGGNNHYYGFVDAASVSWSTAYQDAIDEVMGGGNGHLATIASAAENAFITLNVLPAANGSEQVFLGGRQAPFQFDPTSGYTWLNPGAPEDGQSINGYTNWATNAQPDGGFGSNEMYLTMLTENAHRGEWADNSLTGSAAEPIRGYIIEFDNSTVVAVPEPDAALLLAAALAGLALIGRR